MRVLEDCAAFECEKHIKTASTSAITDTRTNNAVIPIQRKREFQSSVREIDL